jgi:MFS transporter, DHA1 family, inner membrane transport protein
VLRDPQVLMVLGGSALASASLFSVFTYITPILEDITGLTPHAVTLALLTFGLGLTAGSTLGGRLADWRLMPSLLAFLGALAVVLVVFTVTMHEPLSAVITLLVWGMFGFAIVPPLQLRVVDKANDAPNLAATLNQGAFNLGNATGAWLGGAAITAGVSLTSLPWVGVVCVLLSLGVMGTSAWMERRGTVVAPSSAS